MRYREYDVADKDMTYCQGDKCVRRMDCKRWLGMYKSMGRWVSMMSGKECVEYNYSLFWSNKE